MNNPSLQSLIEQENRLRDEFHRVSTARRDLEYRLKQQELAREGVKNQITLTYRGSHAAYHARAPQNVDVTWNRMADGAWKVVAINGVKVNAKESP